MGTMPADAAAELHRERKPYSAVVDRDGETTVVEMTFFKVHCHVKFLDARSRVHVVYSFEEVDGNRVFLSRAAIFHYDGDGEEVARGKLLCFRGDGAVIEDEGDAGRAVTRREGRADVSSNYSPIPSFGRYGDVVRLERDGVRHG